MLSLSIMRLIPPNGKIINGEILFSGVDLLKLSEEDMRARRGKDIAMIFQEPMTSLNPVFRVGDQIAEAIRLHQQLPAKQAMALSVELCEKWELQSRRNGRGIIRTISAAACVSAS